MKWKQHQWLRQVALKCTNAATDPRLSHVVLYHIIVIANLSLLFIIVLPN